ncbi:hypothetical protein HDU83_002398 [Entophlyctis luteolus]|nr:hypothetical protein HDU83_002398 [Entophlyctis luteolus]
MDPASASTRPMPSDAVPFDPPSGMFKMDDAAVARFLAAAARPLGPSHIPTMPAGYTLFGALRQQPMNHVDKYLLGHPSGAWFRSALEFRPHYAYLFGGQQGECLCNCCVKMRKSPPPKAPSAQAANIAAPSSRSIPRTQPSVSSLKNAVIVIDTDSDVDSKHNSTNSKSTTPSAKSARSIKPSKTLNASSFKAPRDTDLAEPAEELKATSVKNAVKKSDAIQDATGRKRKVDESIGILDSIADIFEQRAAIGPLPLATPSQKRPSVDINEHETVETSSNETSNISAPSKQIIDPTSKSRNVSHGIPEENKSGKPTSEKPRVSAKIRLLDSVDVVNSKSFDVHDGSLDSPVGPQKGSDSILQEESSNALNQSASNTEKSIMPTENPQNGLFIKPLRATEPTSNVQANDGLTTFSSERDLLVKGGDSIELGITSTATVTDRPFESNVPSVKYSDHVTYSSEANENVGQAKMELTSNKLSDSDKRLVVEPIADTTTAVAVDKNQNSFNNSQQLKKQIPTTSKKSTISMPSKAPQSKPSFKQGMNNTIPLHRVNDLVCVEAMLFSDSFSKGRPFEIFKNPATNATVYVDKTPLYLSSIFWPALVEAVITNPTPTSFVWTTPLLINSTQAQNGESVVTVSTAASFHDVTQVVDRKTGNILHKVSYRIRLLYIDNGTLPLPEQCLVPARYIRIPSILIPPELDSATLNSVCVPGGGAARGLRVARGVDVGIVSLLLAMNFMNRIVWHTPPAPFSQSKSGAYIAIFMLGAAVLPGDYVVVKIAGGEGEAVDRRIMRVHGIASDGNATWMDVRETVGKAREAPGSVVIGSVWDSEYALGATLRVPATDVEARVYEGFPVTEMTDRSHMQTQAPVSDAVPFVPPTGKFWTLQDRSGVSAFLGVLAAGLDHVPTDLPKGYALYRQTQIELANVEEFLFGHPSGWRFGSADQFRPHYMWLFNGQQGLCACLGCKLSRSSKNSPSPAASNLKRKCTPSNTPSTVASWKTPLKALPRDRRKRNSDKKYRELPAIELPDSFEFKIPANISLPRSDGLAKASDVQINLEIQPKVSSSGGRPNILAQDETAPATENSTRAFKRPRRPAIPLPPQQTRQKSGVQEHPRNSPHLEKDLRTPAVLFQNEIFDQLSNMLLSEMSETFSVFTNPIGHINPSELAAFEKGRDAVSVPVPPSAEPASKEAENMTSDLPAANTYDDGDLFKDWLVETAQYFESISPGSVDASASNLADKELRNLGVGIIDSSSSAADERSEKATSKQLEENEIPDSHPTEEDAETEIIDGNPALAVAVPNSVRTEELERISKSNERIATERNSDVDASTLLQVSSSENVYPANTEKRKESTDNREGTAAALSDTAESMILKINTRDPSADLPEDVPSLMLTEHCETTPEELLEYPAPAYPTIDPVRNLSDDGNIPSISASRDVVSCVIDASSCEETRIPTENALGRETTVNGTSQLIFRPGELVFIPAVLDITAASISKVSEKQVTFRDCANMTSAIVDASSILASNPQVYWPAIISNDSCSLYDEGFRLPMKISFRVDSSMENPTIEASVNEQPRKFYGTVANSPDTVMCRARLINVLNAGRKEFEEVAVPEQFLVPARSIEYPQSLVPLSLTEEMLNSAHISESLLEMGHFGVVLVGFLRAVIKARNIRAKCDTFSCVNEGIFVFGEILTVGDGVLVVAKQEEKVGCSTRQLLKICSIEVKDGRTSIKGSVLGVVTEENRFIKSECEEMKDVMLEELQGRLYSDVHGSSV